MTLDNLSLKVRWMPSTHSVIMVPLLLIPIKTCNITYKRLDNQLQTNQGVLNEVLWQVLQPLTIKQNPSAKLGYYNLLCAAGNFRRCKLVLAAWPADCPEYRCIDHFQEHVCIWYDCPRMNLEILSFLRSNTPGGITTYISLSPMPIQRQPMVNSLHTMLTEDSSGINTFPVSWATSLSPTFSIQFRSPCLTTSRSGFSTSWRSTNGSACIMQSGYPYLHTRPWHQKISHMNNLLNGMGRRKRKWAGTYLEL